MGLEAGWPTGMLDRTLGGSRSYSKAPVDSHCFAQTGNGFVFKHQSMTNSELAQCKYTIQEEGHGDWVSCVRFSPNNQNPIIVSCGWDKYVKVWSLQNCKLKTNHIGHTGYLNTVTMSPDGSLCASGGKDAKAMLWDLNDGKHLYTLDHADTINSLCFSPNRYWLCAATGPAIKIWDLESKNQVEELKPEVAGNGDPPQCLSMAWPADGQTLFAGYSDNQIRVWQVSISTR